jgi:hypothetical protein
MYNLIGSGVPTAHDVSKLTAKPTDNQAFLEFIGESFHFRQRLLQTEAG